MQIKKDCLIKGNTWTEEILPVTIFFKALDSK